MSTDIYRSELLLMTQSPFTENTWVELERNSSLSLKESLGSLGFSRISLQQANFTLAQNGASQSSTQPNLFNFQPIALPNSTASGNPVVSARLSPGSGAGWRLDSRLGVGRLWYFTTAALSSQTAVLELTFAWKSVSVDLNQTSVRDWRGEINVPGSTQANFSRTFEFAPVTLTTTFSDLRVSPVPWDYFSVSVQRMPGEALDTLAASLYVLSLDFEMASTST